MALFFESSAVEFFACGGGELVTDVAVGIDGEFGGIEGDGGEGLEVEAFFEFDGEDGGVVGSVDVAEDGGAVDV